MSRHVLKGWALLLAAALVANCGGQGQLTADDSTTLSTATSALPSSTEASGGPAPTVFPREVVEGLPEELVDQFDRCFPDLVGAGALQGVEFEPYAVPNRLPIVWALGARVDLSGVSAGLTTGSIHFPRPGELSSVPLNDLQSVDLPGGDGEVVFGQYLDEGSVFHVVLVPTEDATCQTIEVVLSDPPNEEAARSLAESVRIESM